VATEKRLISIFGVVVAVAIADDVIVVLDVVSAVLSIRSVFKLWFSTGSFWFRASIGSIVPLQRFENSGNPCIRTWIFPR